MLGLGLFTQLGWPRKSTITNRCIRLFEGNGSDYNLVVKCRKSCTNERSNPENPLYNKNAKVRVHHLMKRVNIHILEREILVNIRDHPSQGLCWRWWQHRDFVQGWYQFQWLGLWPSAPRTQRTQLARVPKSDHLIHWFIDSFSSMNHTCIYLSNFLHAC